MILSYSIGWTWWTLYKICAYFRNLQVVITGLVPGLFYEFKVNDHLNEVIFNSVQVRAINGAGNGNNASVLIALPKIDSK